jgi:plasmid stabilization system protein ParE
MRLRYSPQSINDLAHIYEYLNARRPEGAANVMAAIYASLEFIRRNPNAAETTTIPGVRGKVVNKFGSGCSIA